MASLNKVMLIGNMTRDPELRYTPSGTALCKFSIAISRKYKTSAGEVKDDTVFVNNITAWGKLAEICGEYLQKGMPVFVEGRLHVNSWEDKESGKKINQLQVTAEKIQFLSRKSDQAGGQSEKRGGAKPEGAAEGPAEGDEEAPF